MSFPPITKILKYVIIFGLIFVAVFSFTEIIYKPWKQKRDLQREVNKWQEEMERPYREDKVGGDTPEETLNMFIQALKDGDLDYASKFFVLEKQKEWLENLKKIKEAGYLDEMVVDLSSDLKLVKNGEYVSEYSYLPEGGASASIITFDKNINGKWKITSL